MVTNVYVGDNLFATCGADKDGREEEVRQEA